MRPLRDPAPSRLSYRLNRILLRRGMRRLIRLGVPTLAVLLALAIWASDEGRRLSVSDRIAEMRRQVEERPEFTVRMMSVVHASERVAASVREAAPIDFPISSFDLDLEDLKARIEALDAVAEASLRIRSGGVLDVEIVERVPALIWRDGDTLRLIDAEGHRVAAIGTRTARPDLPLIAGEGAERRAAEALTLYAIAEPIAARLRGLVRIGERRWDLVLDRGQRIMLPENDPATALRRVIALDAAQELLDRAITHIDFRIVSRPVLRLAPVVEDALLSLSEEDTTE